MHEMSLRIVLNLLDSCATRYKVRSYIHLLCTACIIAATAFCHLKAYFIPHISYFPNCCIRVLLLASVVLLRSDRNHFSMCRIHYTDP
jgi:hypothetical protein